MLGPAKGNSQGLPVKLAEETLAACARWQDLNGLGIIKKLTVVQ